MSLLDEVKQRLDIVQVVSQHVDLDTSSRTPKALCPFHSERTPSFVVFPETQTWRCFGACADGGDALSFIMKIENLSFGEALRRAAERLGIPLRREPGRDRALDSLYDANEAAGRYFRSLLKAPGGAAAREYLQGRGINLEVAERRGLGLSPAGLETLAGHLRATGVSASAARDAGLVTRAQDGSWRDMFRGRLTFEIRDARGRLVGFGARSLDGSEPKYLNTPRSDAFDKSRLLYGLNWAVESIRARSTAVVVEGYMDVIAAHEHGFTNVVASMGTAITAEQVGLLKSTAGTVVLAMDADVAGQEATYNTLRTVWGDAARALAGTPAPGRKGLVLKVARLREGSDPDDLIRRSPQDWQEAIAAAAPVIDYLMEQAASRYDLTASSGKAEAAEALIPLIHTERNQYEQERYLTRLADILGVARERLPRPPARRPSRRQPAPVAVADEFRDVGPDAIEDHLLALAFANPRLREHAAAVPPEHFLDSARRAIFTAWTRSNTMEALLESVDGELADLVNRLGARPLPPADQPAMVEDITHCVRRLHERYLRFLKSQEEEVLASAARDSRTDIEEVDRRRTEILES
ncbi:MAG: DNA primase, partial [Gemmatimonadetes bacterium]|nr:DNA primase [Gemmatimonadota bacterium]